MKKLLRLLTTFWQILLGQLSVTAPEEFLIQKISPDYNLEQVLRELIHELRTKQFGKIRINKKGFCCDENGIRVPALCLRAGEIRVHDTLFILRIVYEREQNELYLLLVRSDCRTPLYRLFPQIGNEQDWRVLSKCERYFSPHCSYSRQNVDCATTRETAANEAATKCLQASGRLNSADLEVLEGMGSDRLQLLDLLLICNLYHVLPAAISPNFAFVLRTKSSDDLDELRRVFKSANLAVSATGRDVPVYILGSKTDYQTWRTARNAGLLCYEKPTFAQALLDDVQRIEARGEVLSSCYENLIVLAGSTVWSNRTCVEIDVRNLRFSDEELRVIRKFVATTFSLRTTLFEAMQRGWEEFCRSGEASFIPYSSAWFQNAHYVLVEALFSLYDARFRCLELFRSSDAARVRLRDDRADRYATALQTLRSLTGEEDWICEKPRTKAEALAFTNKHNGAFLHKLGGTTVLAFSAKSLMARTRIENAEFDDFILKLKENHLISHKSDPITFANREQQRFTCIAAPQISMTGARTAEETAHHGQ